MSCIQIIIRELRPKWYLRKFLGDFLAFVVVPENILRDFLSSLFFPFPSIISRLCYTVKAQSLCRVMRVDMRVRVCSAIGFSESKDAPVLEKFRNRGR